MVNITDIPMQYILVKGNNIQINLYAIQLLDRVQCIWLKDQTLRSSAKNSALCTAYGAKLYMPCLCL